MEQLLLDRQQERAALDHLLARTRDGAGGCLVIRGRPGLGRTSLVAYAAESATGLRVTRMAGVQSEKAFAFAALHQLLMPFLRRLHCLAPPRREALQVALGLSAGPAPDLFLLGMAVVNLLGSAAADRPILLTVDDAQWVDAATMEVIAFVVRRLRAHPIAVVVTVREPTPALGALEGLPELYLAGLPDNHARTLLASVAAKSPDEAVADRVVAQAAGNPYALVEFGRALSTDRGAAGASSRWPLPLTERVIAQCLRGIGPLPDGVSTLLLLAATDPSGDQALVRRTADRLWLGEEVIAAAEKTGVLTIGDRVIFTQPLIRSAVYHAALPSERRRIHAALAAATDPVLDAEGRAWHLAVAVVEPDEHVAGELVAAADRAGSRGDHAVAAILLARAADLTPDRGRRAERGLDAAFAHLSAGTPNHAQELLARVERHPGQSAWPRTMRLRANVGLALGRYADTSSTLVRAARTAPPDEAGEWLLDALYAGLLAQDLEPLGDLVRAVRAWTTSRSPRGVTELLLDGFATRQTLGYEAAAPILRDAVRALLESRIDPASRVWTLASWAAGDLLDNGAQRAIARQLSPATLDVTLGSLDAPGDAAGSDLAELLATVWRGQEAQARSAIADRTQGWTECGLSVGASVVHYAQAVLELGLGQYESALAAALKLYRDDPPELGTHALPDLVEAAVRAGDLDAAGSAVRRLTRRARASGTPLASGLLARSQALVTKGTQAEELYLEAIAELGRAGAVVPLARAHLLYGEWLRRLRRRRDAREHLTTAHQLFDRLGLVAFARRVGIERYATAEQLGSGDASAPLTPQETQVARLVAEGASNRQVATQLFVSPNTVEYHLRKVFRKVGVSSRTQLARVLLDPAYGDRVVLSPLRRTEAPT